MKKGGENMEGLIMAARFSLGCNEAALFPEREEALQKFLGDPPNRELAEKAEEILRQFRILFPYLSLIAGKTGLDPFSFRVVEAYFIGNELLTEISKEEIEKMVSQMYGQAIVLDDGAIPYHNFHLLRVLARVEKEPIPPALLNLCMVRMGEVERVDPGQITIKVWFVEDSNSGVRVVQRKEVIEGRSVFVENLKPGDRVAVHWQHICEKLNPLQAKHLEKYTIKCLKMVK